MRYKLTVCYDGSTYHGFQRQANLITIQGEIEKALSSIFFEEIKIASAGRTDAMVHAVGQVIHFDSDKAIPKENLRRLINKHLYPHIYIKQVEYVDDTFHARISAKAKEYRYLVSLGEFDPFKARYMAFWKKNVDINAIKEGMKYFIGEHDFKTFSKNKKITDTVREISEFRLEQKDNLLTFIIIGDGFMHNMVRIMMGVLRRIGEGKLKPEKVIELLEGQNRRLAPYTENPSGLYLYKVYY